MTSSPRLCALRFGLERLYREGLAIRQRPCPPLHAMLAVPIKERLVLLALADGASAAEIKRTLKVKDEDVRLTSPRMREAVSALREALLDPYGHVPEEWLNPPLVSSDDMTVLPPFPRYGKSWDERHGRKVERELRRRLFASTAVCLFGDGVPFPLRDTPLRTRMIVYCLLVEELSWDQVEELLGCSEHAIRTAIQRTMEQIGGT